MFGTKRRNVSLNSKADDDTPLQSKRVMSDFSFGGQAVVPPQVEGGVMPSLDRRRAARQQVRALNTEFASWVQSQLQEHPDELWEDGVRDYLTHTSDLLETYTDVVSWLKASARSEGSMTVSQNTKKKNILESNNSEPKSFPGNSIFGIPDPNASPTTSLNSEVSAAPTSTHGFTTTNSSPWSFGLSATSQAQSQGSSSGLTSSWSSSAFSNGKSLSPVETISFSTSSNMGVSSNNQTETPSFNATPSSTMSWGAGVLTNTQPAFSYGNNSSGPSIDGAKSNTEEDNEPEQPSSPSLKSSEEKGVVVAHETKCKLYLKSSDPDDKEPWKDKGMGKLFIKCQEGEKKGTKESKPRILVRNDVGRIMLNAVLYSGIKINLQKNAIVAIFHTSDGTGTESGSTTAVARTFLIKMKNMEERNKLADAIRDHAPAA